MLNVGQAAAPYAASTGLLSDGTRARHARPSPARPSRRLWHRRRGCWASTRRISLAVRSRTTSSLWSVTRIGATRARRSGRAARITPARAIRLRHHRTDGRSAPARSRPCGHARSLEGRPSAQGRLSRSQRRERARGERGPEERGPEERRSPAPLGCAASQHLAQPRRPRPSEPPRRLRRASSSRCACSPTRCGRRRPSRPPRGRRDSKAC